MSGISSARPSSQHPAAITGAPLRGVELQLNDLPGRAQSGLILRRGSVARARGVRLSSIALVILCLSFLLGSAAACRQDSEAKPTPQAQPQTEPKQQATEASQPTRPAAKPTPFESVAAPTIPEIAGKLLMVKEGSVWRWQSGRFERITDGERFEDPEWSPDGRYFAAILAGENHSELVLLDQQGVLASQITQNWSSVSIQDSVWARHPAWSPDGSRLAYCSDASTTDLALWEVDVEGASPRMIAQPLGNGGDASPSWSPDGAQIAFAAFVHPVSQIYTVTLETGELNKLTEETGGAYAPAWSPDGKRIAYVARNGSKSDIWVMSADGTGATRLTQSGQSVNPTWSPDGQYLAYLTLFGGVFDAEVAKLEFDPQGGVRIAQAWRLTHEAQLEAPAGLSWAN